MKKFDLRVPLFTVALFVSAFLLFWVEPLFTKSALPALGGSSRVWNTALVFFQAGLLGGYLWAHLLTRRLSLGVQVGVHLALVAAAVLTFPVLAPADLAAPAQEIPIPWFLGVCAATIGLPFLVLSATTPLLQSWFAALAHDDASDPYFLYAASNAGSLLALLAFPLLLAPRLALSAQGQIWEIGYGVFFLLAVACGGLAWWTGREEESGRSPETRSGRSMGTERAGGPAGGGVGGASADWPAGREPDRGDGDAAASPWRDRLAWVAFSFVPASMLHGATSHITIEIAAVPLLWVVPLALYLLTFVLVFGRREWIPHRWTVAVESHALLSVALLLFLPGLEQNYRWLVLVHLAALFVVSMVCHGELARRRPGAGRLTEFYLWLAAGGALGGAFNAVVAPYAFDTLVEYPLVLVLAAALVPTRQGSRGVDRADLVHPAVLAGVSLLPVLVIGSLVGDLPRWMEMGAWTVAAVGALSFSRRPVRFGLGVASLVALTVFLDLYDEDAIARDRSFYGTLSVQVEREPRAHRLLHGTTLHGAQVFTPELREAPAGYYSRRGPVGDVVEVLRGSSGVGTDDVGIVGLGAGAMTCYARPGERWTYFEIDPMVVRWARDTAYFTYLHDCGDEVEIVVGDGRRTLRDVEDGSLDLLVLDAFSSDAIPVHLLTQEAVELYRRKLAEGGVLLFNISNRYVELRHVLARLAGEADMVALTRGHGVPDDVAERRQIYGSRWLLVAADRRWGTWLAEGGWRQVNPEPGTPLWTDDHSNVLSVLK